MSPRRRPAELAFLNWTGQFGTVSLVDGTSPFSIP